MRPSLANMIFCTMMFDKIKRVLPLLIMAFFTIIVTVIFDLFSPLVVAALLMLFVTITFDLYFNNTIDQKND